MEGSGCGGSGVLAGLGGLGGRSSQLPSMEVAVQWSGAASLAEE
jgi:hypothetical protein